MINSRPLIKAIKNHIDLPVRGVTLSAAMRWQRPPLITGLTLDDVNLDDYTKQDSKIDFATIRGAYEEFIHSHIIQPTCKELTYRWLRAALGLNKTPGEFLFPRTLVRTRPDTHMLCLGILLWHAHRQNPESKLSLTDTSIVLEAPGFAPMGYIDGEFLSRYPSSFVGMPFNFQRALTSPQVGQPALCRNGAANALWNATENLPKHKKLVVQTALQIVFWREAHVTRTVAGFYRGERSPIAIRDTVREIRARLMDHPKPRKFLYENLVPNVLDYSEFQLAFGNPFRRFQPKVTEVKLVQWDLVLKQIAEDA
jgi:hypothetical protein